MNCKTIIIDNICYRQQRFTAIRLYDTNKSYKKKNKMIMYNKNLMIGETKKYILYIIIGLLSINSLSFLLKNVIELCIVVVSHKMDCSFFFAIFE